MRKDRYTIGQFSALTGITKDTLRFYDKQGILTPNVVDKVSKYRYYTEDQFWFADMVVALVRLGVPLQNIKEAFATKDENVIISLLAEKRGEALRLSEYYMRMADDIEWMERNQELEMLDDRDDEVRVEYFTERKVIFRRNLGLGADIPDPEDCVDALIQTDSIRRTTGRIMELEDFMINRFTEFGSYLDMGMGGIDQVKPEHLTYLPAGEYACCITMENEYGEIDFEPLLDWLKEHDKKPAMVLVDRLSIGFFGDEEEEDEDLEEDLLEDEDAEESSEAAWTDENGAEADAGSDESGVSDGDDVSAGQDEAGGSEGSDENGAEDPSKEERSESFSDVVAGYQALVGDVHVIEDFEMTEELTLDLNDKTEELDRDLEDVTEDLTPDVMSLMNERSAKKTVKVRRKYEVKVLLR